MMKLGFMIGLKWMLQSPGKITKQLDNANSEDLIVSINSPGGYVDEGSEIYTALKIILVM